MLMPKKVKHRKQFTGRMTGAATRGAEVTFGDYGLQATECGWLSSRQLEAARRAMTRYIKRGGKIWIRTFPHKPLTSKPAETRMGKGKGSPEKWLMRKGPNPNLSTPLDITGHCTSSCFKLTRCKPAAFKRLQGVIPETYFVATTCGTSHTTGKLLSTFYFLRH